MKFTQARVNGIRPPAGKSDHEELDEAMPGFGVRFRNGGSGAYFIKYRIGGRDGRLSLGKVAKITLADAQSAARRHFALLADKVDPSIERAKAVAKVNDTIEPLIGDFVGYLRRKGRSESYQGEVERSFWRRYSSPARCIASMPPTSTAQWSRGCWRRSGPTTGRSPPIAAAHT